jgi:hypothetical protein
MNHISLTSSPNSTPRNSTWTGRKRLISLVTVLVILGLQTLAIRLMNLPLNRVIELRYCRAYYQAHDPSVLDPDGNVSEELCKLDTIQQNLAWLQGAIETLHIVCGN